MVAARILTCLSGDRETVPLAPYMSTPSIVTGAEVASMHLLAFTGSDAALYAASTRRYCSATADAVGPMSTQSSMYRPWMVLSTLGEMRLGGLSRGDRADWE
jgi:hypothetical protein